MTTETPDRKQLVQLTRPFVAKFIKGNPSGGGTYVSHDVVVQRLLQVVGPYDFHVVQVLRGFVPGKPGDPHGKSERAKAGTPDLHDVVVGVIAALTVQIDGRHVTVQDCGDCEAPHNWPHDGARMKDAVSDAIKRCAMRIGLGLHLWSQDEFYVHDALRRDFPEAAKAADENPQEQLPVAS